MFAIETIVGNLSINKTHCTYGKQAKPHGIDISELNFSNAEKVNSSIYRFNNQFCIDFDACTVLMYPLYQTKIAGQIYYYDQHFIFSPDNKKMRLEATIVPEEFYPFGELLVNPYISVFIDVKSGRFQRFTSEFNITYLHRNDYYDEELYDYLNGSLLDFRNGDFAIVEPNTTEEPEVIEKVVEKVVERIVEKKVEVPAQCPKVNCDNKELSDKINLLNSQLLNESKTRQQMTSQIDQCAKETESANEEVTQLKSEKEKAVKSIKQTEDLLRICKNDLLNIPAPEKCELPRNNINRKVKRLQILEFGCTALGLTGLIIFVALL